VSVTIYESADPRPPSCSSSGDTGPTMYGFFASKTTSSQTVVGEAVLLGIDDNELIRVGDAELHAPLEQSGVDVVGLLVFAQ